jgi:hypothetical protein
MQPAASHFYLVKAPNRDEATLMPRIRELLELARQSYALATGTVNPDAKKTLQEIGREYEQKADELRRTEITQAVFPDDKK